MYRIFFIVFHRSIMMHEVNLKIQKVMKNIKMVL